MNTKTFEVQIQNEVVRIIRQLHKVNAAVKFSDDLFSDDRLNYKRPYEYRPFAYSVAASSLVQFLYQNWDNNNSLLNRKAELIKVLEQYKDMYQQKNAVGAGYNKRKYNIILEGILICQSTLHTVFSEHQEERRSVNIDRVSKRSSYAERIEINTTQALENAYNVLSSIQVIDGELELKTYRWVDVALSIVAATGRRMSEVMGAAEFYELEDDDLLPEWQSKKRDTQPPRGNYIVFSGALKKKSEIDKTEEYIIPTLIPASLVLLGIDYLNQEGKRDLTSSKDINARYSKVFSEQLRTSKTFSVEGLKPGLPDIDGGEDPRKLTTHKFRAAYFRTLHKLGEIDSADFAAFARSTLLDKSTDAAHSYQRYDVQNETLIITE